MILNCIENVLVEGVSSKGNAYKYISVNVKVGSETIEIKKVFLSETESFLIQQAIKQNG